MRVVVVDDSPVFLETISAFLSNRRNIDLVGRAPHAEAALALVQDLRPDLVIVDMVMPKIGGVELTKSLKKLDNPPRVIMLTLGCHPKYYDEAVDAGAETLIVKIDVETRLMRAIESPPVAQAAPPPADVATLWRTQPWSDHDQPSTTGAAKR